MLLLQKGDYGSCLCSSHVFSASPQEGEEAIATKGWGARPETHLVRRARDSPCEATWGMCSKLRSMFVWVKGFGENLFSFRKLFSCFAETGNYTCEFCGKQYKYYTPYQEHVALHAPISEYPAVTWQQGRAWDPGSFKAEAGQAEARCATQVIMRDRPGLAYLPDSYTFGIYFEKRSCSYFRPDYL